MGSFKIDTGKGTYKVTQNAGDLKAGIKQGDLSRISAYEGSSGKGPGGLHTGAKSPTVGRGNKPF